MTIAREILAVRGLSFSVRREGRFGEPVMLLHGFPESSAMWAPVMTALAQEGRQCVAPDQRGYSSGARPSAVEAYVHEELVADILALADALGWARFHLVGHDWGAVVAWLAAIAAPERLLSLTALSIPHYHAFAQASWADPEVEAYRRFLNLALAPDDAAERVLGRNGMAGLRAGWPDHDPAEIDETLALLGEPGALSGALAWYRASDAHRRILKEPARPVTVPTLLICGRNDPYVRPMAIALGEAIPTAGYRRVDLEAGHWLVQERPAEVIAAIGDHIRRHAARTMISGETR